MRKTKRRILRTKRRVLKSKRRTTQRKFKYQRGGDPEEELKSQVEEAIKLADDKKSNAEIKFYEWKTKLAAAFKADEETKKQAIVVKKLKPSSIMGMFSSAPKNNPQEAEATAELERLTNEANKMFAEEKELNKEWHALVIEKQEMIKKALSLLKTFVENFPQDSNISRYHELIRTYSENLMYSY
jgi:hypothetical protein